MGLWVELKLSEPLPCRKVPPVIIEVRQKRSIGASGGTDTV